MWLLESHQYFSMSSVSPENQLSSLPPDLTALVFTLLEVGGVDSMTAEMKTHFTEIFKRWCKRYCKRCCNWLFLMKETCTWFYSRKKIKLNLISFNGYLIFRERTWLCSALKMSEKAENHMVFTSDLWLVIKALEFPRFWNIFLYDCCKSFLNMISFQHRSFDQDSPFEKYLQRLEI